MLVATEDCERGIFDFRGYKTFYLGSHLLINYYRPRGLYLQTDACNHTSSPWTKLLCSQPTNISLDLS